MKFIEFGDLLFSKVAENPHLKLMETMVAQRPQISRQSVTWAESLPVLLKRC